MVDFRINETLPIGEVRKHRLPGIKKPGYDTGRCVFSPHRIGAVGNSAYQTWGASAQLETVLTKQGSESVYLFL